MVGKTVCAVVLSFCLMTILVSASDNALGNSRETVLDRKIHIMEKMQDVPQVQPFCDEIKNLKREKTDIGSGKLYCEQEGKGFPVVLVSGGPGCTHHIFHPYFSQAANYARVIYYDQRGVGQSDKDSTGRSYTIKQAADDLDNLRKALGIKKWVVIGHSYGGFLAQCYALEHPENLTGLVLVCAQPGTPNTPLDKTRQLDYMTDEEAVKVRSIFADEKLTEEQRLYNAHMNGDWKRQNFYRPTNNDLARMARYEWKPGLGFRERITPEMSRIDLEGKFASFDIPTLIVEAKWDLTWNTDKPAKILNNHPGAKMVVFENSGHSPFIDEPNRFFSILGNFIKNAKAAPVPAAGRTGTRISWPPAVLADIMEMGLKGNAERAASLMKEAEEANLADFMGWYLLGLNLYGGRDYEESLAAFQHCEALADENDKPWQVFGTEAMKGVILDLLLRRDEALKCYQKALDCYHKANGKPGPDFYRLEVDEYGLSIDPKMVEEWLKTPFERVTKHATVKLVGREEE